MPTYTVTAPAGRLTGAQKATLAHEITRTHNKHTGAQTFFAQVMFVDFLQGNWFVGGVPIDQEQIFLHGQVRSGRPPEVKEALLKACLSGLLPIMLSCESTHRCRVSRR